ncbi:hypothetical protein [Mucilaginibacter sp.]|uniref:hypothetical protein n=1 Tax=Mucilaginibacter sp. TaxID=1882438 RepID=UPI003D0F3B53
MIEKTLKTTQGWLRVSIPTQLKEVTLGQLMAMQEKPDLNDLEAISILSGIAVNDLQNVINMQDFEVFTLHVIDLSQQISLLYDNNNIPQKITFYLNDEVKTVSVIKNLSVEPAGAFMAARDIIADEINAHIKQYGEQNWQQNFNPSLKACCQVLAHYFFCRVTGKLYNEYEADEFCTEIKKLMVTEALPSIVASVMTTYFGLKSDINSIKTTQETETRINNIRIKVLEDEVVLLQKEVNEIKFTQTETPDLQRQIAPKINSQVLLSAVKKDK